MNAVLGIYVLKCTRIMSFELRTFQHFSIVWTKRTPLAQPYWIVRSKGALAKKKLHQCWVSLKNGSTHSTILSSVVKRHQRRHECEYEFPPNFIYCVRKRMLFSLSLTLLLPHPSPSSFFLIISHHSSTASEYTQFSRQRNMFFFSVELSICFICAFCALTPYLTAISKI